MTPASQNGSRPAAPKRRTPRLTFYHPNSGGTGSAAQWEAQFHPADGRAPCLFLEMAAQKTAASRAGDTSTPATFDWDHKITVKFGFADLCELLMVLSGQSDRIGGARHGLFHTTGGASTIITLQKAEPGGYWLGLSKKADADAAPTRVNILLSPVEALGLQCVIQTALFFIAFPIPGLTGSAREPIESSTAAAQPPCSY